MSRSRVVLIANNFPPIRGGSAVVYANLARWAGDELIVLAPCRNYGDGLPLIGWREHDLGKPYRVVRLNLLRTIINGPQGGPRKLFFLLHDGAIRIRLLAELVRLILVDRVRTICIGELLASGWVVRLFRFVPGVRTVAYVHGEEITTADQYDEGHRRGRRYLMDSDQIVVVSRFTQQAVASLLGNRNAGRISLIENGVDAARFHPQAKAPDLIELYRLGGSFVYVSVCRLLEKKGIDNAIRAFALVAVKHPDSRYLVVGTGAYADQLQALAKSLGLDGLVVFAGQVADDELSDHYRLGEVFVMPNRELPNGDTEGFGLVFLEANSCGLPVIAGRDGGSTDAVQDGRNGLVVDGADIDAIAAAMLLLRDQPHLRSRLRQQGLDVAAAAGWAEKTAGFLRICHLSSPGSASGMTRTAT